MAPLPTPSTIPKLTAKSKGTKRKATFAIEESPRTTATMTKLNIAVTAPSDSRLHDTDVFAQIIRDSKLLPAEIPLAEELGKIAPTDRIGLMWPTSYAMHHPATPLLEIYSRKGCPVDAGKNWSVERIIAAIKRGAHISTKDPDAREALINETEVKVQQNFMIKIRWGDIKDSFPQNLKVSPVAMIPHKSRSYRVILDLSFNLLFKGRRQTSVNEDTIIRAPQKAMSQLGLVLHRIVFLLASNFHPFRPFKFCKVDIKDGFWRMSVNSTDAWNFCYTIPNKDPATPLDDTIIVVPTALQMGWTESPPFFCAGTETARDIIDDMMHSDMTHLPFHESEDKMMNDSPVVPPCDAALDPPDMLDFVEVYVDDFIGGTNSMDPKHLRQLSRVILHGIHSIFPHQSVSGHTGEDTISQKKNGPRRRPLGL